MRSSDDIIRMAQPASVGQERLLDDFTRLTRNNPDLIRQLSGLLHSRLTGNRAAGVREAFERLRWDVHLRMSNDLVPLMGRVLLYVYPDLNGMVQLNPLPLDETLGMRVGKRLPGDYARRLEWYDGRPLAQPPLAAQPARLFQGKLFEVAG